MDISDAGTSDRTVPLDLASLVAADAGGLAAGLDWPTPYGDYAFLSREFIDQICMSARAAATSPELEAVVESKLCDTVTDLSVIARLALDLRNIRANGARALYDKDTSAWLEFLVTGGSDASHLFGRARWHFETRPGPVAMAKRSARRWHSDAMAFLLPRSGRYDILSRNGLLDDYFAARNPRAIAISPNYRDWPAPDETPIEVKDLIAAMIKAFARACEPATGDEKGLATAAMALAGPVITGHFGKAWADLERVRGLITARRAGETLAGGTPKHIGRLFAWQYAQLGREVVRFAHGGERAFYDDYAWSLAELPYCDRYYCHSSAEAAHLQRRRGEGRMAPAGSGNLTFIGQGSTRQRDMRTQNLAAQRRQRTGRVMYVAGGYLGETLGDFPSRKPPDALYFEWQTFLLGTLRNQGYRVVTKVHPKGILNEAMVLRGHSDEIARGFFDPESHDADCYIFDFAGTAFFDALASGRGIVLLDMGVRPRDTHAFDDLKLRCEVVECSLGEGNRFRLDTQALGEAIERASAAHEWPDRFFDSYFRS